MRYPNEIPFVLSRFSLQFPDLTVVIVSMVLTGGKSSICTKSFQSHHTPSITLLFIKADFTASMELDYRLTTIFCFTTINKSFKSSFLFHVKR